MKHAVRISDLDVNKFINAISNLIKKSVSEGADPNNTILVVDLVRPTDTEIKKQ